MQAKDGGPAFPTTQYVSGISPTGHSGGMTLRDYFAAKALQGMLATEQIQMVIGKTITQENIAGACYEWADVMLKAR